MIDGLGMTSHMSVSYLDRDELHELSCWISPETWQQTTRLKNCMDTKKNEWAAQFSEYLSDDIACT